MKRLIPPDLLDLSLWPSVDPNALTAQRQQDLINRIEAVRLYAAGTALSKAEDATGVPRMQIYRLVRRCIEPHADGRIRGFRALIPFTKSKPYQGSPRFQCNNWRYAKPALARGWCW